MHTGLACDVQLSEQQAHQGRSVHLEDNISRFQLSLPRFVTVLLERGSFCG